MLVFYGIQKFTQSTIYIWLIWFLGAYNKMASPMLAFHHKIKVVFRLKHFCKCSNAIYLESNWIVFSLIIWVSSICPHRVPSLVSYRMIVNIPHIKWSNYDISIFLIKIHSRILFLKDEFKKSDKQLENIKNTKKPLVKNIFLIWLCFSF